MVCIYCNSATKIINSREQKKPNNKWRRRKCLKCSSTLTTIETVDYSKAISVLFKDKSAPFSRNKLFISIYLACKHRKDALSAADALTDTALAHIIRKLDHASVSNGTIRDITLPILKRFDKSAYVQYDAYHKD